MEQVISSVISPITVELGQFNEAFDEALVTSFPVLKEVLSYVGQSRGKGMRPILVLLCAKMLGGRVTDTTIHAAISMECLHTASLIHDDVVDESTLRRGRTSVCKQFGNKLAVLSGDYLLACSLEYAARTNCLPIVEALSALGRSLAKGEIEQLSIIPQDEVSEEMYEDIIRRKTAAVFSTAAYVGALSVGATPQQASCFRQWGEWVGMAFQMKDDLLDYSQEETGKPALNDLHEGKITLPAIYALQHDPSLTAPVHRIKTGMATPDEINGFAQTVRESGGMDYTETRMQQLCAQAMSLLPDDLPGLFRSALQAYMEIAIQHSR